MVRFKFLKHTADIKFQAFGKTLEEVFENSALAMFKSMSDDSVKGKVVKKLEAKGHDNESLLYDFLEELLVLFDGENFILSKVKNLKIKDNKVDAEVIGDDAGNYDIKNDIKAVTYNDMFVKKEKGEWVAQVVLDV